MEFLVFISLLLTAGTAIDFTGSDLTYHGHDVTSSIQDQGSDGSPNFPKHAEKEIVTFQSREMQEANLQDAKLTTPKRKWNDHSSRSLWMRSDDIYNQIASRADHIHRRSGQTHRSIPPLLPDRRVSFEPVAASQTSHPNMLLYRRSLSSRLSPSSSMSSLSSQDSGILRCTSPTDTIRHQSSRSTSKSSSRSNSPFQSIFASRASSFPPSSNRITIFDTHNLGSVRPPRHISRSATPPPRDLTPPRRHRMTRSNSGAETVIPKSEQPSPSSSRGSVSDMNEAIRIWRIQEIEPARLEHLRDIQQRDGRLIPAVWNFERPLPPPQQERRSRTTGRRRLL